MRYMRVAYLSMNMPDQVVKADEYDPIMKKINLSDGTFTPGQILTGLQRRKSTF